MRNIGREETILDRVNDYIYDKYSVLIGKLERIYEVFLFIPVIYSTIRWDHSSIFIILEHWLKRMEDVHRNDKLHVDANKRADEIHTCILLLKRINSNGGMFYYDNAFHSHDLKWGETINWTTPTEDGKYHKWHTTKENIKTEDDKIQERKEFRNCMNHEHYLENQDVKMLFTLIKKYYKGWWV